MPPIFQPLMPSANLRHNDELTTDKLVMDEDAQPRSYFYVGATPSDAEEATPCDNFVPFA